jgi:hypothetical protein
MEPQDQPPPPPSQKPPAEEPGLPDKPRLRPLEAFMVDNPNRADRAAPKLLVLRDPSGMAPEPLTLPPMGVAVVELFDGERTQAQICGEFQRRYNMPLTKASLEGMLRRLDEANMLDSPRFRAHAAAVHAEFARAETRPAIFAGRGYPADAAALAAQLDGTFARPNGPGLPDKDAHLAEGAPAAPRAIIAPHVDMNRGGPAYAWAYRPLLIARELPTLIVVLGTNHNALDPVFTLTTKHFDTPLGPMRTDKELVTGLLTAAKGLADALPARLLYDEHQHRGEHSLEYQMIWLRYVLSRRGVRDEDAPLVLPILCGSLQDFVTAQHKNDDPMAVGLPRSSFGPFLTLLREQIQKRVADGARVLFVCAADLAHVGPRYGDAEALTAADCDSLERRDRETLRSVCQGDADGWLREIRRERDARRVCGLAPIYATLKAADLKDGQLRCYAQCQAEAGSVVSIASVIFP